MAALEAAGHPVLRVTTRNDALGAEFFRWEFATAVAGAVLGINPFDEPNVAEAKEKTKSHPRERRTQRRNGGRGSDGAVSVFYKFPVKSPAVVRERSAASTGRLRRVPVVFSRERCDDAGGGRDTRGVSGSARMPRQTFGVGPRYLHSTGQYHKGGPNTPSPSSSPVMTNQHRDSRCAVYLFAVEARAGLGDAKHWKRTAAERC